MRKFIGIVVIVILVAGCRGQEVGMPTSTLSPVPKNTDTPILTPSRTTRPIKTATITNTPYPTYTPLPLPYPDDYWGFHSFSPNGEWVAWAIYRSPTGQYLLVERVDRTIQWEIVFDFSSKYGWGGGAIIPYHWSFDSRYLYYGITSGGDGGYPGVYEILGRIDLNNGNIKTTIC